MRSDSVTERDAWVRKCSEVASGDSSSEQNSEDVDKTVIDDEVDNEPEPDLEPKPSKVPVSVKYQQFHRTLQITHCYLI